MDNGDCTPPPPDDAAAPPPDAASRTAHLARTTTRLHPRLGAPSVFESSMGARLLWPAGEPWPTCPGSHFGTYDEQPVAAVPVLQLFRRDVGQLPFPEGTDVLQVLWCPRDHDEEKWPGGPKTSLYWRDSAAIPEAIADIPVTPAHHGRYMLEPCVLHPEPGVVEYPSRFEAGGSKVGGWPSFCQEPHWPDCTGCGRRAEYLLTIGDLEGEDGTADGESPRDKGLVGGGMQLFYCPNCPGSPHIQYYDR